METVTKISSDNETIKKFNEKQNKKGLPVKISF